MSPHDPFHEKMLRHAIALAARNVTRSHGGPFGAIVTRGHDILAEGVNLVTASHDPTAHAEIVALRHACRALQSHQLTGCTVYASCEPCPMCLAALYWARVGAIFFAATKDDAARAGFDDSFLYLEIPRPLADRTIPTTRLPLAASTEPFTLWSVHSTKIPY